MAARPKNTVFGFPAKAQARSAAPRKWEYEASLCQAIDLRLRVELRYDDDAAFRTFEPYCVYHTTKGKVCVSGTQVSNPEKPLDSWEPHNFEVGRIADLRLTSVNFQPDSRFDPADPKYKRGSSAASSALR